MLVGFGSFPARAFILRRIEKWRGSVTTLPYGGGGDLNPWASFAQLALKFYGKVRKTRPAKAGRAPARAHTARHTHTQGERMAIYETLGVDKTASAEAVRNAYKDLALKHHPDRGGDATRWAEIQRAYDALSERRGEGAESGAERQFAERFNTRREGAGAREGGAVGGGDDVRASTQPISPICRTAPFPQIPGFDSSGSVFFSAGRRVSASQNRWQRSKRWENKKSRETMPIDRLTPRTLYPRTHYPDTLTTKGAEPETCP